MKYIISALMGLSVILGPISVDAAHAANRIDYPHKGEVVGYSDTSRWLGNTSWRRPNQMAVGDSIMHRVYLTRMRYTNPGREVSAVPGRDVCNMPYYIQDRLRAKAPLKTFIWALGTNASPECTYEKMGAMIKSLPRDTKVVLVNTYRDPIRFPDTIGYRSAASTQTKYAKWFEKYNLYHNVCVARWRQAVVKNPLLVHDGVHPTDAGIKVYVDILNQAIRTCN